MITEPRCKVCNGAHAHLYRNGDKYVHIECLKPVDESEAASVPGIMSKQYVTPAASAASGWVCWDTFAARLTGFIEWAEPAPAEASEERYAIVLGDPGIAWIRVSPNPDVHTEMCSGRFYDTGDPNDHPEGAIEWARNSAKLHKEHVKRLVDNDA